MNVRNILNNKGNTVANQFILSDAEKEVFQSYNSKIATCISDIHSKDFTVTLYLEGDMWDYNNTTRKYFKQFINEETPFTYENKAQWLKEIENNGNIKVV